MKPKNLIAGLAAMLCITITAHAQTTLTAWNFDSLALAPNSSPASFSGLGVAGPVGLGNASTPSIISLAGSSSGGPKGWQFGATGGSDGWTPNAAIGSQGAKFAASTFGYYQVKISFDVNATTDAEAYLQVQYTTDGHIWNNATIASVGTLGVIASNSNPTNSLVVGSYVVLTNNGTTGWNNQIKVDLTGVSGADNNPNFAVRIVNAATGTNCLTTTGAPFSSSSGSWTFDNVLVQGVSIDTIADWTFESYGTTGFVPNPIPELYFGATNYATALGFDNNYTYAGSASPGSTNAPDTLVQGGSSTPTGTICWRVRGAVNNGWNSAAPIGTQGTEYDVSTLNYSNIVFTFDLYFTTQGEAKMCVLYTTNGWATTNVGSTLAYGANPTFIQTNDPANVGTYSPNTVSGPYFYQTTGQNWYNNWVVDFTGLPGVDNNPNFGVRVVNAATGADCVNFTGGSYNNSSGNCRFDNVTVGGTFAGSVPPAITYDPSATVDGPFTNTFTDDPIWRASISSIYVNGSLLAKAAYAFSAGQIVFTPSQSVLFQSSDIDYIVINATNYSSAKVTQPLLAGVATKFVISTQPAAPSASGGTLTANPVLAVLDKYGNGSTNPYASVSVTASVGAGAWTLGGAPTQPSVNGIIAFTNLSATVNGLTVVSNALITFTVSGYAPLSVTNSAKFNIGAPPVPFTAGNLAVFQIDTVANNTTFSFAEVAPSIASQTSPVNIVPISATGTNALRQSSAGSTGRLGLSDDGTLLCFGAFVDGSAATPDETFNLSRESAALTSSNQLVMGFSYNSITLGGSEARSACILDDDYNWIVNDKGGLYQGNTNSTLAGPNLNAYNNVVVKMFGGIPYVETQKTANGVVIPVVYALNNDGSGLYSVTVPNNLSTDPVASDFYLVSTNGGTTYDILYVNDQVNSSQGVIRKYSWVEGADPSNPNGQYGWGTSGSFTNTTGIDGLFATTNGNGGIYLFYTTGAGGTAGNSIIRVTDAAGWNGSISIISSNLIYTTSKTSSIKGLTFAPQTVANVTPLIPPPILTAQTFATTNSSFTVTNTPDNSAWRSAITGITVNGSILAPAAYDTTQPGKIVFDPSQSALLQNPGSKTILISATAYSLGSVTQVVAGVPAKLAITTQPKAPATDGGALATQPVVAVQDQFGNAVASSASILAAPVQGTWTLGGTTTKAAASGTSKFTNLTAFGNTAVSGATITFTSSGLNSVTSSAFNIPAPIKPTLGGVMLTASGKLTFSFTNATGLSFSVLATNDLTAPIATWPVVGPVVESPAGSGSYQYTNSSTTNAQSFYILRQP
jgi:Protein of unknown function (DUF1533)